MDLTKKQKLYIEYSLDNPLLSDLQCSKDLDISSKQIYYWKSNPEFVELIDKELNRRWHDSRKIAQQKMNELASGGDYRACEFLMKTTGVNPAQQVDVKADVNNIKITIDD